MIEITFRFSDTEKGQRFLEEQQFINQYADYYRDEHGNEAWIQKISTIKNNRARRIGHTGAGYDKEQKEIIIKNYRLVSKHNHKLPDQILLSTSTYNCLYNTINTDQNGAIRISEILEFLEEEKDLNKSLQLLLMQLPNMGLQRFEELDHIFLQLGINSRAPIKEIINNVKTLKD